MQSRDSPIQCLPMTPAKRFLDGIEAFLKSSGMAPTAFGSQAVGDPNFVSDLRAGRAPNLRLVGKVQDFIEKHARQKSSRQSAKVA